MDNDTRMSAFGNTLDRLDGDFDIGTRYTVIDRIFSKVMRNLRQLIRITNDLRKTIGKIDGNLHIPLNCPHLQGFD